VPHLADQTTAADTIDRVDHDTVTDSPVADTGPERHDVAGKVDPHDARHRDFDSRHTAPGKNIMVVQGGRFHAHHNLACGRPWIGKILHIADRTRAAMLVDHCCFHGVFP
jgi:hypothetical protein